MSLFHNLISNASQRLFTYFHLHLQHYQLNVILVHITTNKGTDLINILQFQGSLWNTINV